MTGDEFEALLALGHEHHGVEFKGPGPLTDKHLRAKVVRAALSMANRRDGGKVIIGVDDTHGTLHPTGLSDADLATWEYDVVADALALYADPSLNFDRTVLDHGGKRYLILRIAEFEEIPILCKGEYQHPGSRDASVLRRGACYVRSRRKPETAEIPTHEDMRELLELATEKRLRQFFAQAHGAGLNVAELAQATDANHFKRQLADLAASDLARRIRSRGYWEVVIRPVTFVASRVPDILAIPHIVQQTAVEVQGWDFPRVSPQRALLDAEWAGQEIAWVPDLELWRLYRSGQFVYLRGLRNDWHDPSEPQSPHGFVPMGRSLGLFETLHRFTAIYEFAARLAMTEAGDEQMSISITVDNLQGRTLTVDDPGRGPLYQEHTASLSTFPWTVVVPRAELIARPSDLALEPASELFRRFGFDIRPDGLRGFQQSRS